MKRNYTILIASLIIFVCAKLWFRNTENNDLLFLLAPTNSIIELFTASKSVYDPQLGYRFSSLGFLIDKSCSGFNFLLISFLMATYIVAQVKKIRSFFTIPIAICIAYITTILANTSRIASYLILMQNNIIELIDPNNNWLHRAEGILVYLSFLILSYFLLNHLTTKLNKHEKAA